MAGSKHKSKASSAFEGVATKPRALLTPLEAEARGVMRAIADAKYAADRCLKAAAEQKKRAQEFVDQAAELTKRLAELEELAAEEAEAEADA